MRYRGLVLATLVEADGEQMKKRICADGSTQCTHNSVLTHGFKERFNTIRQRTGEGTLGSVRVKRGNTHEGLRVPRKTRGNIY